MLFRPIALFALAASASASIIARAAAPAVAHTPGSLSTLAIQVLETCVDTNLNNCLIWSATTLPVGCTNIAAAGQASDVSSVSTVAGVVCTLFSSTTCTGTSQIINGTLNALAVVGYDNTANSFTCVSS
ncbi:hypothetical protein FB45DRAFT_919896 [Roridomyces roridus]|uniref:Uncharacterized protein n=1 Tax=Roridomyces roridus TaxID=1738132 RepID=A0AAD7BS47_9AGAR|nr:hypothetical protein FB45DRAFT_919896 [Roridomyces roridus]